MPLDRGASFLEWGGFLLVVAAILGVLVASGIPTAVAGKTGQAVCRVFRGDGCQGGTKVARPRPARKVPPAPPPAPAPPPGPAADGRDAQARPLPSQLNPPTNVEEATVAVLERTPTGREALEVLDEEGVEVVFEPRGSGGAFHEDGTIHIEVGGRSAEELAAVLVHEANHAHSSTEPNPADLDRDDYIEAAIDEEVESETLEIEANQELQRLQDRLGETLVADRPTQKVYEAAYKAAGRDLRGRKGSEKKQREAAQRALRDEYLDGNIDPTGNARTYPEHYGSVWDEAHSGSEACAGTDPVGGCVSF